MRHFDTIWKIISTASALRDIAIEKTHYQFQVQGRTTFYLDIESSDVIIHRHKLPQIDIEAQFQAAFGWRYQSEQDEAGVYVVARRRRVLAPLLRARVEVSLPQQTYLALRLSNCALTMTGLNGTLHVPPADERELLSIEHISH